MTEQEARIKRLKVFMYAERVKTYNGLFEDLNECINALEKQIAKKPYVLPINREENFTYCPNCKRNGVLVTPSYDYCTKCGQKLDWGNEDAE